MRGSLEKEELLSALRGRNIRAEVLFDGLMGTSLVRTRVESIDGEVCLSPRRRVMVPSEFWEILRWCKGSTGLREKGVSPDMVD